MSVPPKYQPILKYLSWGALLAGIALRIVVYFQNRSLFIDEGALASQLVAKNFVDFFEPLSYQFSPPLFSCLVKSCTLLLGANEFALRLIPLLAGIASLLVFYQLLKKLFSPEVYLFILGVFSFALPYVHYSTECKQYSTDILTSSILLALFYKYCKSDRKSIHFIAASIVGILAIWFSMPVVFVLFGIGFYFLFEHWNSKNYRQMLKWFAVSTTWIISFVFYFFMILKKDADIGSLASYHSQYFFPLLPSSIEELSQAWELLMSFLKTSLRATVLAQLLGLTLFIAGIVNVWRKNRPLLFPLLLPIIASILASGIGLYSLIPRMTLFAMPLVFLILAYGIQLLLNSLSKIPIGILSLAMLIVFINLNTFRHFYLPFQKDEIRPVLEYVHQHQKANESVFVHHLGSTAFRFYQYHHDNKGSFELQRVIENNWKDNLEQAAAKQSYPCWLVLTHVNSEEEQKVLTAFEKYGSISNEFKSKNAFAYLIK